MSFHSKIISECGVYTKMGLLSLGRKMLSGAAVLGGKALKSAGALGTKISSGLLDAAHLVEGSALGGLVQSIPGYDMAKGAIRLGGRVAGFSERLGEALQQPTLQAGLDKLGPLMNDAQVVYNRGKSATTKEGFLRSELEKT